MTHHKHTKLEKPIGGLFHKNELSFIGAPCDRIQSLVTDLIDNNRGLKIAFADASHDAVENDRPDGYKDNIHSHLFQIRGNLFNKRNLFKEYDTVFINDNHFRGNAQILILNTKKKESLSKKIDRLTNVQLILNDDASTLYEYLKGVDHLKTLPVLNIKDIAGISTWLVSYLEERKTEVLGCVFMGGKSSRMGKDKAMLDYHGMPQYAYVSSQFKNIGIKTILSVTHEKVDVENYDQLKDEFIGLGPFGGLLTAFKNNPNKAILSCPCDTPLIDANILKRLIDNRDTNKIATCFYNPDTDFPEPLITLWESHAYPVLLEFLSLGYSCPRKVLINSAINMVDLKEDSFRLKNVNTPQEKIDVVQFLNTSNLA